MADLEADFLARLQAVASDPAALRLSDDAAVLPWPLGADLVATHDMLAEGVHFTADCPPADIGWKLVAVTLSDLAAMGARPVALLMGAGFGAARDAAWAGAFLAGVAQALDRFAVPLIGGDTIRTSGGTVICGTVIGATALGQVPAGGALARSGAAVGDDLWVSGTIGGAGLGLRIALGEAPHDATLLKRYRRPMPRLALGEALRGLASACMDVSDGLLIDAGRLADASGVAARIALPAIPCIGEPLAAATAGDDYELLFTARPGAAAAVLAVAAAARTPVARIGTIVAGEGLALVGPDEAPILLPPRLGYMH